MLVELHIRNFAIIEEASLEFAPGLNVLTGETGAGKTIILSALGLLLGSRATSDVVRSNSSEAVVEGIFHLEGEIAPAVVADRDPENRELLIRRAVGEAGRSRASIDGELATVQTLSKISGSLVQVYGQHEQHSLMRAESHPAILDRYARLDEKLARYRSLFDRTHDLKLRLDDLVRRERERANLLELARFRVAELERAQLVPGEDEELALERSRLVNATRLASAANDAEEMLYGAEGAALDAIAKASARLADALAIDPRLKEPCEMLEAARANLGEAARALRSYADKIEADPARLEQVDNRLQELTKLKRKYGGSLDETISTLEKSRVEIAELEHFEEARDEAQAAFESALAEAVAAARELSTDRKRAVAELKRRMEAELKTLGMRSPVFEARVAALESAQASFDRDGIAIGPDGCDATEFYLSANLGQPPMPLGRIASGGELSRVMLALKRLEAQQRGLSTMIFDEVDAGIGGEIAQVVGRKLKQLAQFHQVLCVTHLAQIAAFADRHFMVEKEERRGSTRSRVRRLDDSERVGELARMLGGGESEKFRRAAKELLERAISGA
ncbi:MAG TPA: DNA repair protein RecN [Candidatus Binataceae bacterium]|nr:DNA repair protein RecN [Candidatus Binataceae bacterium]